MLRTYKLVQALAELSAILYNIMYYTTGDIVTSETVFFREKSKYDGGSFQFTLTCVSSGGPATNVTWTRNSETLSDGMRSVLDDSENATYTHTLIVTRRLGGHYQCNVSNNKPSSDSSAIFIQGCYFSTLYSFLCT